MDAAVARAAAERRWVLSSAELRDLGLSPTQIAHRVRSGVLHRVYRGVYSFGRPHPEFHGACRAALLACGSDAAISHGTAARLWGLRSTAGVIHVTVPRSRAGHPRLRIHRPRSFVADDVTTREGIQVATVARTVLDLAADESQLRVERLLHEASVQRVLDARDLWTTIGRLPGHRGAARVRAALQAEFDQTRSGLERAFLALCRRAAVPRPVVNGHLPTSAGLEEVDFHWPQIRLVIETDGARYHASRWRRRRDAEKTARLRAAGWTVRRFAELDVTLTPTATIDELREFHALGCRTRP